MGQTFCHNAIPHLLGVHNIVVKPMPHEISVLENIFTPRFQNPRVKMVNQKKQCGCWSLQHLQAPEPPAPAGAGASSTCSLRSLQHLQMELQHRSWVNSAIASASALLIIQVRRPFRTEAWFREIDVLKNDFQYKPAKTIF